MGFCRRTRAARATATGVVEGCAASVIVRVTAPKGWAAEVRSSSEAKPCSGPRSRLGKRPCPARQRLEARSRPGARARPEGRARSASRSCLEARARTPRQHAWKLSNKGRPAAEGYLCHFAVCNTARGAKKKWEPSNLREILHNRAVNLFNVLVQYMIWKQRSTQSSGKSRRSQRGRTH